MRYFFSLLSIFLLGIEMGYAQQDWQYLYEDQEERAEELFNFYFARKQYREALPHLEWLLDQKNEAVYHHRGIIVYKKMALEEKDQDNKNRYAYLCLRQFDELLPYSEDSVKVLNRKLNQAYQFFYDKPQEYPSLLSLSEETLRATARQFAYYNFTPFVQLLLLMEERRLVESAVIQNVATKLEEISSATENRGNEGYRRAMQQVRQILANNH